MKTNKNVPTLNTLSYHCRGFSGTDILSILVCTHEPTAKQLNLNVASVGLGCF